LGAVGTTNSEYLPQWVEARDRPRYVEMGA
jgi:hypothetical protein